MTGCTKMYTGETWFQEVEQKSKIKKIIFRNTEEIEELAIDFINNEIYYTATLQMEGKDYYVGTHTCENEGSTYKDTAKCRVYRNNKELFLFGEWYEDECVYYWYTIIQKEDKIESNKEKV